MCRMCLFCDTCLFLEHTVLLRCKSNRTHDEFAGKALADRHALENRQVLPRYFTCTSTFFPVVVFITQPRWCSHMYQGISRTLELAKRTPVVVPGSALLRCL